MSSIMFFDDFRFKGKTGFQSTFRNALKTQEQMGQASQIHKIESFDSGKFDEQKQSLNFNLTKKPDLVWIAKEYFQCNYIHKSGFIFTSKR